MKKLLKGIAEKITRLFIFACFFIIPLNIIAAPNIANNLQNFLTQNGYNKIPLRHATHGKVLIMDASFGNNRKQGFLIDTGSQVVSMDQSIAQIYDFKVQNANGMISGNESKLTATQIVSIPQFIANHFAIKNLNAYLQDYSTIKIDQHPIIGFLGINFLTKYNAIIDVANKRLYLQAAQVSSQTTAAYQKMLTDAGYKVIKILPSPTGHRLISVGINDNIPVPFLFDTGVTQTTLSRNYAKQIGLPLDQYSSFSQANGGGGTMAVGSTLIQKLVVGPVVSLSYKAAVLDFKYVQVGTPIYGALGIDWMQKNNAIIDVANNLIFVKPNNIARNEVQSEPQQANNFIISDYLRKRLLAGIALN